MLTTPFRGLHSNGNISSFLPDNKSTGLSYSNAQTLTSTIPSSDDHNVDEFQPKSIDDSIDYHTKWGSTCYSYYHTGSHSSDTQSNEDEEEGESDESGVEEMDMTEETTPLSTPTQYRKRMRLKDWLKMKINIGDVSIHEI